MRRLQPALTRLSAKATIPPVSDHRLAVDTDAVTAVAKRSRVSRLSRFGSVLRDHFRQNSDIEESAPDVLYSPLDLAQLEQELQPAFQRNVDTVEPPARKGAVHTSGTCSVRRGTFWSSS